MDDAASAKLAQPRDILAAFTILSRWPVPIDHDWAARRGHRAAWAFPLVGAILALGAGLIAHVVSWLGVPIGMSVVAAAISMVIFTGAMHEDGLADSADGLGPIATQERRFEIMSDSNIGAFGAIALILAFLARWNGYICFEGWGLTATLITAAALSRAMIVVTMFALPPAKSNGLSATFGQPDSNTMFLAVGFATLIAFIFMGWSAIPIAIAAAVGAVPVLILAHSKLGGQTGDILGAVQITSEISALAIACALM